MYINFYTNGSTRGINIHFTHVKFDRDSINYLRFEVVHGSVKFLFSNFKTDMQRNSKRARRFGKHCGLEGGLLELVDRVLPFSFRGGSGDETEFRPIEDAAFIAEREEREYRFRRRETMVKSDRLSDDIADALGFLLVPDDLCSASIHLDYFRRLARRRLSGRLVVAVAPGPPRVFLELFFFRLASRFMDARPLEGSRSMRLNAYQVGAPEVSLPWRSTYL